MKKIYFVLLLVMTQPTMALELDGLSLLEAFLNTPEAEIEDSASFYEECINNEEFGSLDYNVECGEHFHHYNSTKTRKRNTKGSLRISHFNALHPGNGKTRFKDYELMAKMLSIFDIIAVTELIPAMASELKNNQDVRKFSELIPQSIEQKEREIKKLQREQKKKFSVVREREIKLEKLIIKSHKSDLKNLKGVYRLPGYLKILNALREYTDDNWSLIISASPEGTLKNPTKELTGFFYKENIVKPIESPYCDNRNLSSNGKSYACHPLFDRRDLGRNKRDVFSRRPFLGSFQSGRFKTTLIGMHSLFDSPEDSSRKREILRDAFNENSLDVFPVGINNGNYARFAELKVTLDFIDDTLKSQDRNDIILLGDFNLESQNKYMDEVLESWKGSKIFIDDMTSTSDTRFNKRTGEETLGLASNYDHFIFEPRETSECMKSQRKLNGGVFDFINIKSDFVGHRYKIRNNRKNSSGKYSMNQRLYKKVKRDIIVPFLNSDTPFLEIGRKDFALKGKHKKAALGIIAAEEETADYAEDFYKRVLKSQLQDSTYYNFYKQVISDHLPIYMSCDT